MCNIKIFVTHIPNKEDEIINNNLMINVVAGADYQTKPLSDSFVPDNTGDNISKKNKAYCELTTQYWAWKNIKADYYGFCHYRRFLSLTNKKYTSNDPSGRGQIYIKVLNDTTAHMYQLDNDRSMQAYIEKFDCILPCKQNLSTLPTPIGKQQNVYKHFEGHNRLFMNGEDLQILLDIISEKFPQYFSIANEFLNQSFFWGYNCFILKKEYFFELCDFEFSVLKELENRIDMSNCNQQMARMPGFMGEILSCIYFYKLIKEKPNLRLSEVQLLYFENTLKNTQINPIKTNNIPIVFNIDNIPPFLFLVTIKSLLNNIYKAEQYDIIILHWNISSNFIKLFDEQFYDYTNIRVSYINLCNIYDTLKERHLYPADSRILLPWILSEYNSVACFNWNILFNQNIKNLNTISLNDQLIIGCKDILMIGMANDVSDKYEKFLVDDLKIEDKNNLLDYRAFIMNLSQIRQTMQPLKMLNQLNNIGQNKKLSISEELNIIFQKKMFLECYELLYYYTEDINETRVIKQAPLNLYNKYNANENKAFLISYNPSCLGSLNGSKINIAYWNIARTLDVYHLLLEHFSFVLCSSGIQPLKHRSLSNKAKGCLRCIRDHGFLYTVKYGIKKIIALN